MRILSKEDKRKFLFLTEIRMVNMVYLALRCRYEQSVRALTIKSIYSVYKVIIFILFVKRGCKQVL